MLPLRPHFQPHSRGVTHCCSPPHPANHWDLLCKRGQALTASPASLGRHSEAPSHRLFQQDNQHTALSGIWRSVCLSPQQRLCSAGLVGVLGETPRAGGFLAGGEVLEAAVAMDKNDWKSKIFGIRRGIKAFCSYSTVPSRETAASGPTRICVVWAITRYSDFRSGHPCFRATSLRMEYDWTINGRRLSKG